MPRSIWCGGARLMHTTLLHLPSRLYRRGRDTYRERPSETRDRDRDRERQRGRGRNRGETDGECAD